MDPTHRYLATDEDADQDDNGDPRYYLKPSMQDTFIPPWEGAEASRSDRLAIASLVKRYYTAAAAEDGAHACTMLSADIPPGEWREDEGQIDLRTAGSGDAAQRQPHRMRIYSIQQPHQRLDSDRERVQGPDRRGILGGRPRQRQRQRPDPRQEQQQRRGRRLAPG
jgi:hypothetical protein